MYIRFIKEHVIRYGVTSYRPLVLSEPPDIYKIDKGSSGIFSTRVTLAGDYETDKFLRRK